MPTAGQIIRAADFAGYASDSESTDETGVSSTTFTGGTTPCGTAFTAPTSGRVLIQWQCRWESDSTNHTLISAAVRTGGVVGSGTSVASAVDALSIEASPGAGVNDGRGAVRVVTGLTAGDTYNAQIEFRVSANTSDIFDRLIVVTPIP